MTKDDVHHLKGNWKLRQLSRFIDNGDNAVIMVLKIMTMMAILMMMMMMMMMMTMIIIMSQSINTINCLGSESEGQITWNQGLVTGTSLFYRCNALSFRKYLFFGSYWFLIVWFVLLCHRRAFKKFYADFLDYQAPVEDFYIEWQFVLLVITELDSWLDRET